MDVPVAAIESPPPPVIEAPKETFLCLTCGQHVDKASMFFHIVPTPFDAFCVGPVFTRTDDVRDDNPFKLEDALYMAAT